jgi:16S rRNA (uracil1498-N3)-methyltransferase
VHRFLAPALDPGDDMVALPREEGEHLTRVLRLGVGDTVSVFDGRGTEFLARVVSARRRDVRLQVLTRVTPVAESPVALTLVPAVLKGDRMDDVVRDSVMLGVSAIQPIVTARTETSVAALLRGGRVDRWRRVALASVKQSRRAVVPEIRVPLPFDAYLEEPRPAMTVMLVEPDAGAHMESVSALREMAAPDEAAVMVGPEGGWFEAEWRTADARGVRLVTLGPRTLRADAVPIVALSLMAFLWDAL